MEQPSYYAIIPANVRYDKELKPNEKLLFGEIVALTQKDGSCWATNRYFAELYDTTNETISRYLNHLKEKGYITIEFQYSKENSKLIEKRIIRIDRKINTHCSKNQGGIDENIKENNTSNNNNIPPISPQGETEEDQKESDEEKRLYNFNILWDEYPRKDGKVNAYRHYKVWLKGRDTPLGRKKLTNSQMYDAIQNYKMQIADKGTDSKYIKQGSTFFNLGILDYLPKEEEDG